MAFSDAKELAPAYTSQCPYIRRCELYMNNTLYRLHQNKTRIARVLLVLFVMAWVNLVYQAPVHAAMKFNLDMPCHCVIGFCDIVLGMQDLSDDGLATVLPVMAALAMVVQIQPVISLSSNVSQHVQRVQLVFQQSNPPPLRLTGILHI